MRLQCSVGNGWGRFGSLLRGGARDGLMGASLQFVHSGFLDTAARAPERVAMRDDRVRFSYGDCLALVRRLAGGLQGVLRCDTENRPVAIIGDKGPDAVIAILATLYLGRAYSFLHPAQKAPRLRRMVEPLRRARVVELG